jgi:hypothetical protein
MALSSLLLVGGKQLPLWLEVGATFVAVDTLVHNFLHRTGSWAVAAPTTLMGIDAISQEGAPAFSGCWRQISMLDSSIRPFRRRFHGSCRARSGGTAPRTDWMFATAIGSTMMPVATIGIANSFAVVIA